MEANTPRIGWIEEAAAVVSCLASTLCIPSSSLLGSLSSKAESMRFSKHERGNLSSPLMHAERSISWWERQTPTSPGFAKGGGCGINCFLLRPQLIVPALAGGSLGQWSPGPAAKSCLYWAQNPLLSHLWATLSLLKMAVALWLGWRAISSSHFWKECCLGT